MTSSASAAASDRAEGAQVRGGVTEVALGEVHLPDGAVPWISGIGLFSLGSFGAVPRLIGSTFRLLLLITLGALAYMVARRTVEQSAERVQDNPVKATFVGLAAGLLIGPILFITCFVLILTIIGIPLLLLIPFIMAFVLLLALVGFTGTAYAIGQWANRRFGIGGATPGLGSVVIGVVVILLPLMLARVLALGGCSQRPSRSRSGRPRSGSNCWCGRPDSAPSFRQLSAPGERGGPYQQPSRDRPPGMRVVK